MEIRHKEYLRKSGIYIIRNKINDKSYIGQAVSIYNRYIKHRNGYSQAPRLESAVKRYGWDSFEFDVLEICEKELLNEREEYWILFHKTLHPNGYNLIQRQDVKRIPCKAETKKKISEGLKRTFPNGRTGKNNPFFGKKHTEETRALIKANHKVGDNPRKRRIKAEKDDVILEFKSITEASRQLNCYRAQIWYALKHETLYRGYKWSRIDPTLSINGI